MRRRPNFTSAAIAGVVSPTWSAWPMPLPWWGLFKSLATCETERKARRKTTRTFASYGASGDRIGVSRVSFLGSEIARTEKRCRTLVTWISAPAFLISWDICIFNGTLFSELFCFGVRRRNGNWRSDRYKAFYFNWSLYLSLFPWKRAWVGNLNHMIDSMFLSSMKALFYLISNQSIHLEFRCGQKNRFISKQEASRKETLTIETEVKLMPNVLPELSACSYDIH